MLSSCYVIVARRCSLAQPQNLGAHSESPRLLTESYVVLADFEKLLGNRSLRQYAQKLRTVVHG